ncbi:MAG: hypothetical protein K1X86_03115 [Ignavibacteria bacterium]|nr:hypothetical protein [Ignavibacteria bacterium]
MSILALCAIPAEKSLVKHGGRFFPVTILAQIVINPIGFYRPELLHLKNF